VSASDEPAPAGAAAPANRKPTRDGLLEREAELAILDGLLHEARQGAGRAVIVTGPAGIGKTRLLQELRRRAEEEGLTTLAARGSELERDFPFACVRQLFEPLLTEGRNEDALLAGDARLATPVFRHLDEAVLAPDPGYGTLHGLYWLTANVAERSALLAVVDDAHWADPASLRYLSFLATRLDGLPAVLAVSTRSGEPRTQAGPLREIAGSPSAERLALAPLSETAVAELVRSELHAAATNELSAACYRATGGNPFYLRELLRDVKQPTRGTDGLSPARIEALGPEGLGDAVISRLERLGAAAPGLARAVAVLGDGAALQTAAALAALDPEVAASAADELGATGVLEPDPPLRFAHPIVRRAVYNHMPPAARDAWHARAASLLTDAGESAEAVSLQLLATHPGGHPQVVEVLREGARDASARGAPDAAVRYLERALAEPPPPSVRPEILCDLGNNAGPLGDPRAVEWLQEAMEQGDRSPVGTRAAFGLVTALTFAGRTGEALTVGQRALDEPAMTGELRRSLESWLLTLAQLTASTRRALGPLVRRNLKAALAGEELPAARLSDAALECAICDGKAELAAELAERAVRQGLVAEVGTDDPKAFFAAGALILAERFESADRLMDEALADARARGAIRGYTSVIAIRAWARYREGRLADVLAEAELHPRLAEPAVSDLFLAGPHIQALVEAGKVEAAAMVAAPIASASFDRDLALFQRFAEGHARLRLAQNDPSRALEVLGNVRAWEEGSGQRAGTWVAWRSQAALAHEALGDHEEALTLAEEQVALAQSFGAPGMLGTALRALGVVRGGEEGIATLGEATESLRRSPLRLEYARALVDLGAALRAAAQDAEAHERLHEGLDVAQACGATALLDRALDELVAAGERPRRRAARDVDTLTPSERRVAEMASDGMSNKDIAQALFVTVKTVETHLGHAYAKLGINSRAQLPARLAHSD
jgi:DNA-binding CsgD family transcriptional regulator